MRKLRSRDISSYRGVKLWQILYGRKSRQEPSSHRSLRSGEIELFLSSWGRPLSLENRINQLCTTSSGHGSVKGQILYFGHTYKIQQTRIRGPPTPTLPISGKKPIANGAAYIYIYLLFEIECAYYTFIIYLVFILWTSQRWPLNSLLVTFHYQLTLVRLPPKSCHVIN